MRGFKQGFVIASALGVTLLVVGCGAPASNNSAASSNSPAPTNATNPGSGSSGSAQTGFRGQRGGGFGNPFSDISTVLKVPQQTLMTDLKNGQTVLAVSQKEGISEKTLVSDLQSSYQTNLNKVVQSGRITATQAKQMEQRYISSLPAMLTRKGLPTFHGGYRGNGNASGGASTSTSGANTTA